MRRQTRAQLAKDTAMWTLTGLGVMLLSGMALYSSDPDMYYLNYAFGRGIGYIEPPLDKIHAGWGPPHAVVPAVYLH